MNPSPADSQDLIGWEARRFAGDRRMARLRLPTDARIAPSGVFSSCATPATSCPSAAIFSDWIRANAGQLGPLGPRTSPWPLRTLTTTLLLAELAGRVQPEVDADEEPSRGGAAVLSPDPSYSAWPNNPPQPNPARNLTASS